MFSVGITLSTMMESAHGIKSSTMVAAIEGVTEELKRTHQTEWVRRCNNINNRAEEIILHEIIYL